MDNQDLRCYLLKDSMLKVEVELLQSMGKEIQLLLEWLFGGHILDLACLKYQLFLRLLILLYECLIKYRHMLNHLDV